MERVGFMVYEPLADMKLSPMPKRTESGFRQAQVSILVIIGRLSSTILEVFYNRIAPRRYMEQPRLQRPSRAGLPQCLRVPLSYDSKHANYIT
jgi:hypothetical protein